MMADQSKRYPRPGPARRENGATVRKADAIDSSELISYIQSGTETQKAALARELHDELGGLLVGAVMDLAWAEQHLTAPPAELKTKLARARQTLSSAIDLKRRLIEDLRPTLLDNVGLFAALRWHVKASCATRSLECSIDLPEEERRFLPNVPIALFRIVQEAWAVCVSRGTPNSLNFSVTIDDAALTIGLFAEMADSNAATPKDIDVHALATLRHRTETLGGAFVCRDLPSGGTTISAGFPLGTMLQSA